MTSSSPANSLPKVFIGSTSEAISIAETIRAQLHFANLDCIVWSDSGTFGDREVTFYNLMKNLDECSYAVLVLSPDDRTISRKTERPAPRDNVIFELGLFIGRYGLKSVFMVAPHEQPEEIRLPSDLAGIFPLQYKVRQNGGVITYDVGTACFQIVKAIEEAERLRMQPKDMTPRKFWDALSDTIIILFGAELSSDPNSKGHPRVSLRDLETAHHLTRFLARSYPQKIVSSFVAGTPGLEHLLKTEADLILIGGFVANPDFAHYQSKYEDRYRGKMGRICVVEGQRTFHVKFGKLPPGMQAPPRNRPEEIEAFPSVYVARDYGAVTSSRSTFYGRYRRVVTVAGIKGNGTQGAAMALTQDADQPFSLDALLPSALSGDDAIEILVATDVLNGTINSTSLVSVTLNARVIHTSAKQEWEPCELERECQGCTFGTLRENGAARREPTRTASAEPKLKAIIFDLDDTLVDTFTHLITPLEYMAAHEMVAAGIGESDAVRLGNLLLELRRNDPEHIEEVLLGRFPGAEKALEARREVFRKASPEQLRIEPGVLEMLRELRRRNYGLYLMTTGASKFQQDKIRSLRISNLFEDVSVHEPGATENKESVMRKLIPADDCADVVVVGNRLDNEIRAGNRLGMITVWLKQGEGSGLSPKDETEEPRHTISSLAELPKLIEELEAERSF